MIETERLILRPWRDSDLESFARMNSDPRVMEFLLKPLSREESDAWVARAREHDSRHGFGLNAVELKETGAFIGYVGLAIPAYELPCSPCVEIGWRLAADHWNRGFASEGAKAALRDGFDRVGLREIVSFTVPLNVRSRRVMEKIGMTRDLGGDFDHPRVPVGHPLRRAVLYRIGNPNLPASGIDPLT